MPSATQNNNNSKSKKMAVFFVVLIILIGVIVLVVGLRLNEPQTVEKRAAEPTPVVKKETMEIKTTTLSTDALCPKDGAICQWTAAKDAKSYIYEIIDVITGEKIASGTTEKTKITFTPLVDREYRCTVKAVNECGEGPEAAAENMCTAEDKPTPTPKPSNTPTAAPTNTPMPTETPAPGPTNTPTPGPSSTPTPTATNTPTPDPSQPPAPTEIILVNATNTPAPEQPTATPKPAPPVSGIFGPTQIVIGISILIILAGLIL